MLSLRIEVDICKYFCFLERGRFFLGVFFLEK